jgi:hypothetical protein
MDAVKRFRNEILRAWYWALRRRSQKGNKMPWKVFRPIFIRWVPNITLVHPWPYQRFDAMYLR